MAAMEYQYDLYSGDLYRGWLVNPNKRFKQNAIHRTVATPAKKKTNERIVNNAEIFLKLLKTNKNPQFKRLFKVQKKKAKVRKQIYYAKKPIKAYQNKRQNTDKTIKNNNKKIRIAENAYALPLKIKLTKVPITVNHVGSKFEDAKKSFELLALSHK